MQIVIEISEDTYKKLTQKSMLMSASAIDEAVDAVKNGIVLPKGHGDLIDRSKLETTDVSPEPWYSPMWAYSEWMIDEAEVIIPADKDGD